MVRLAFHKMWAPDKNNFPLNHGLMPPVSRYSLKF